MDWVSLFLYCLSLLAVVGFCNVWFAADDDPDLRVRIRPLWLQRVCRFLLAVVCVSLPVIDLIVLSGCHPLQEEDSFIHAVKLLGGFFFVGAILVFFAFVFYAICNFVAWCLKELAKYVWNE